MSGVPLKRLARVVAGQSPSSVDVEEFVGIGLPFLQGNAEFGESHPSPVHRCDAANKRASVGTLLVSVRAPVGALNVADRDYGIGRGLAAIETGTRLDDRFCWWWTHAAVAELRSVATGSTYEAVASQDIGNLLVPLVSTAEQRAIADFLDTETAHIDALIAKKRRLAQVAEERLVRSLNALFGVDHETRADGVPVGLRGQEMVRLGYVAQVQSGLTIDAGREAAGSTVTAAYLRVANVQDGRLDLAEIKEVTVSAALADRCTVRPGDVLMTEGGDPDKLGRGAVWPQEDGIWLHQNHVFVVRPDTRRLNSNYLSLVTRTSYARRYFEVTASKTTGIASTSTSKIADFRVPLSSLADQALTTEAATGQSAAHERFAQALNRQIALLQEHRQALITAAVSGEAEITG